MRKGASKTNLIFVSGVSGNYINLSIVSEITSSLGLVHSIMNSQEFFESYIQAKILGLFEALISKSESELPILIFAVFHATNFR